MPFDLTSPLTLGAIAAGAATFMTLARFPHPTTTLATRLFLALVLAGVVYGLNVWYRSAKKQNAMADLEHASAHHVRIASDARADPKAAPPPEPKQAAHRHACNGIELDPQEQRNAEQRRASRMSEAADMVGKLNRLVTYGGLRPFSQSSMAVRMAHQQDQIDVPRGQVAETRYVDPSLKMSDPAFQSMEEPAGEQTYKPPLRMGVNSTPMWF